MPQLTPLPSTGKIPGDAGSSARTVNGGQGMAQPIVQSLPRTPVYSSTASAGLRGRLRTLFERRNLIWELTARNLKVRYRRSVFGFLWSILNPLLQRPGLHLRLQRPAEVVRSSGSPLFITVGLVVWNAFAASVMESMSTITGSAHLVTRVRFPARGAADLPPCPPT